MADNPNPNDPNHSLNRRREERSRHLLQDSTNRLTDITAANLDLGRSILTWYATAASCYADVVHNISQSVGQMAEQAEHINEQPRRTG